MRRTLFMAVGIMNPENLLVTVLGLIGFEKNSVVPPQRNVSTLFAMRSMASVDQTAETHANHQHSIE